MAFYRTEDGRGTMHVNFGRKTGPLPCVGPLIMGDDQDVGTRCSRISVALCDHPAGVDLAGNALTCDAPLCERHRTKVGLNLDRCPRHTKP